MARIKRKYIESHWLIFAIQGIITFLCGWYIMFSGSQDTQFLVTVVGAMLLALAIVEVFNLLHREHLQNTWSFTLVAVAIQVIAGLLLVCNANQNAIWALLVLTIYTFVRGVCELLIAFKSIDDRTDRFIWALCGVCGVIISFVVLNSGHLPAGTFLKFFASYLVILGAGNLLYGIHNHDQKLELTATRKAARAKATKARKKRTTKKSSTKKRTKKTR